MDYRNPSNSSPALPSGCSPDWQCTIITFRRFFSLLLFLKSFGGAVNITVEGWGPILGVNLEKKYTSKYTLLHMTEKRTGEILVVVRSEGGLWTVRKPLLLLSSFI
jgi:hypothetical protein